MLPPELLSYTRLFGRALLEMGTQTEDFVQLSQRIGRTTGGIVPTSYVSTISNSTASTTWFLLRGKATMEKANGMLEILRDVLLTARLDNLERFRQIVLEEKAEQELYAVLRKAEAAPRQAGSVDDFLNAFLPMIPVINNFFDQVLVMAEDQHVRQNRLGLLQRIAALANGVADFSRLEGF